MRKITLLTALVLLLVVPASVAAAEPVTGRIEGSVVNETQGGTAVANQELSVKVYLNGSEMESKTAKTGADGLFSIDGLSTQSGYSYQVTLTYQQADYNSETITFEDGITTKSVKILVYDSTVSDTAIRVETAHTIVYTGQDGLEVRSYALFGNAANLTYIGAKELAPDKRETLRFFVPKGATELQYGLDLMECCVFPGEGGFSDTMSVLPGNKEVAYAYRVPYSGDGYTLLQKFDYATDNFDFLVQGESVTVTSDRLVAVQPVTIEGKQFSRYSAESLQAGDVLEIKLSGLPQTSGPRTLRWLTWGLLALAFGGGLTYLVRRKRSALPVPVSAGDTLIREKERLLRELAELDDSFARGALAEDNYRRQRATKKNQLLKLIQTGGGLPNNRAQFRT